jgi:hypothetical protein
MHSRGSFFIALLAAAAMAGCAAGTGGPSPVYAGDDDRPIPTGSHIPVRDGGIAKSKSLDKQSTDDLLRRGPTNVGGSN